MTPYYDEDGITIYHGDCREVLPVLGLAPALVLTDPPYGVGERTDRASKGRGSEPGKTSSSLKGTKHQAAPSRDFLPVHGDDEPFDPSHLLRFPRLILWGANHYAERLPSSPSWIVWDKLDGLATTKRFVGVDDNADCEMAWSNCGGPARIVPHRWKGMVRASEQGDRHLHPTQKPVWLMARLLEWRTEPGDLVLDPYAGSGPVLVASKLLGRRAVGIEYERAYCDVMVSRLAQGILDFGESA